MPRLADRLLVFVFALFIAAAGVYVLWDVGVFLWWAVSFPWQEIPSSRPIILGAAALLLATLVAPLIWSARRHETASTSNHTAEPPDDSP